MMCMTSRNKRTCFSWRLAECLQVFKEAMLLYPPAYATSRRALRNVEIDGYRVPKGRVVLLALYMLHRREGYFPPLAIALTEHQDILPTRLASTKIPFILDIGDTWTTSGTLSRERDGLVSCSAREPSRYASFT